MPEQTGMTGGKRLLMRMSGRPRGSLGRLGGIIVARANRTVAARAIDLLGVHATDRVLEVGFGPGVGIQLRAESVSSGWVVGVEGMTEGAEDMADRSRAAAAVEAETMATVMPEDSRFFALTTYRRDGRPVTTPVWAVPLDGKLYVVTAKSTGKVRRVGATGRVRFAPCNVSGSRVTGEWREGTGRVVQDESRRGRALAALRGKYGWQLSLAMLIYRLRGLYHDRVVLELTPSPAI
jgi:PPOX class probable F420-dependent enzyme